MNLSIKIPENLARSTGLKAYDMDLSAADVSKWAKVITVLAQGLTSGSAYYITMVEAPARMENDMPTAVRIWKPLFNKAKNSQV